MNSVLDKVSELIEKSKNIPENIKLIVKAVCRGYIRESNGKIPIEGIINVCDTMFIAIAEDDKEFSGENLILGHTDTDYDDECNVIHKMSYVNASNYAKLIAILTHELGHVITEAKPCIRRDDGVYPFIKMTATLCTHCFYKDDTLCATNQFGFRISDGFLESICTKIYNSSEFRQELYQAGYDLKDYVYKDERLFPSRIYDEYKACFELFDYILNGVLFHFSCRRFESNQELVDYFNGYKLPIIFSVLDKSNDALSNLKRYEGQESDEKFKELLEKYIIEKGKALQLAKKCYNLCKKNLDEDKFQELYNIYASMLEKQKTLPIPDEYFKSDNQQLI